MVDVPGGGVDAMGNPTGMPEQVWVSDQPSSSYTQAMGNVARTVGHLVDGAVQLGVNGAITNMVVRPASGIAALPALALGTDAYTQIQADLQERWSPESNNPGAVAIRNSLGQMLQPVGQTIQQLRDASERRFGDGWTTAGFAAAQGALEVGGFLGGVAAIPAGRIALGNLGNGIRGGFTTLADAMPVGSGDAARRGAGLQRGAVGDLEGVGANVAARTNSLARIAQDGHALERHGGGVTDQQLLTRALTGVAPDGSSVVRNGQTIIPPSATAFHSDALLAQSDQFIRRNYLDRAIALSIPGAQRVTIENVDMGINIGRGFNRVSSAPGAAGPLQFNSNLSRATAVYGYDAAAGVWRTVTIYPVK